MADVGSIFVKFLSDTSGFKKGNAEVQQGINTTQKAATGFGTAMKALGPLIAGAFSVTAVVAFGKATVQAWDESERAAAKLLAVTKGNKAETDRLIANAGVLQGKTLFNDEDIQNAQLMLKSLGLTSDQIIRITPLVADLATKMDTDLGSAGNLVAKSIGSSTNALARYGVEIEGAAGSSERFDSAVAGLTRQVEGLAEAAAGAGVGSARQFKNAWDDVKELIGGSLGPGMAAFSRNLKATIEQLSGAGKTNYSTTLKEQARAALEGAESTEEANRRLEQQKKLIEENITALETRRKEINNTPIKGWELAKHDDLNAQLKETKAQLKGAEQAIKDINDVIKAGTAMEWVPVKAEMIANAIDTIGEMEEEIKGLQDRQRTESEEVAKITQLEINGWQAKIDAIKSYGKESKLTEADIKALNELHRDQAGLISNVNLQVDLYRDALEHAGTQDEIDRMSILILRLEATRKAYEEAGRMIAQKPLALPSSVGTVVTNKQLAPNTYDPAKALDEYNRAIAESKRITVDFTNMAVGGFQDIAVAIGQLASGETSIQGFFANILKAIARFMQEFGAAMIAAAAAKIEFEASFIANTPLAIATGIGLVAAGTALYGVANKGIRSYAEGGIVYGPTIAQIGEYPGARSNPEVVAPLSKLENIFGSKSIQGEFRVRGRDLVYVLGEEMNFNNRT
ncbi:MAG: hypothetical protein WC359_13380 [Dehalococcoidia bacterium]